MKITTTHFVSLFAVALLSFLSGCNSVESVAAPHTQMTVRQARKALVKSLEYLERSEPMAASLREMKFNRQRFTAEWVNSDGKVVEFSMPFAAMDNLSVKSTMDNALSGYNGWSCVQRNGEPYLYFRQGEGPLMFIDAVLTLKVAALAPYTEEADFAAFTASAQTWLVAMPKPGMSEEVRTFKVLAEDAFKRKDFTAALDAYGDALEKFPLWPEGHYNAALLAAETEDYELAAQHMRRYLVLAPNARDAAAAKDKFLLWQLKGKQ